MSNTQGVLPDTVKISNGFISRDDDMARVADLTARATSKYSVKDYDAAAELYSKATELQAQVNGEMSSQNADLLYAYGRCLYHLAVKKSDVLGTNVTGERQKQSQKKSKPKLKAEAEIQSPVGQGSRNADEVIQKNIEEKGKLDVLGGSSEPSNKPYFQFTGDENWGTSDEEDTSEGEEEEEADEEEDFVNAFEVLDLARVLLVRNLDASENSAIPSQKGLQVIRQIKERLADTYDLQAEISLEGERFPLAVADFRSALDLKTVLFPQNSSLIAEAHYKLSLALEFSSVTQEKHDADDALSEKVTVVDETREEAAREMEAAIASCKIRMQIEDSLLAGGAESGGPMGKQKVTKSDIDEVKETIKEMEQRLIELRQPPVSAKDFTGTDTLGSSNPLDSVLSSLVSENPQAQRAKLKEPLDVAMDLTDRIKRKKQADVKYSKPAAVEVQSNNGKRKVDAVGIEEVKNNKKPRAPCDDGT